MLLGACDNEYPVASLISRPEQEFREMFSDIWAARPESKTSNKTKLVGPEAIVQEFRK